MRKKPIFRKVTVIYQTKDLTQYFNSSRGPKKIYNLVSTSQSTMMLNLILVHQVILNLSL